MTVRVTFDFDSHDEALVFLARASQTKVAAAPQPSLKSGRTLNAPAARDGKSGDAPSVEAPQSASSAATPITTRKPRNDAGKVRGPHKQSSEGAAGEPAAAASPAVVDPVAAPEEHKEPAAQVAKPAASAAADGLGAADPTEKDCQAAMTKVWEFAGKDQIATCRTLLERFGVKRIGEIGADLRAEFIAKCEGVLKGEPV